MKTKVIFHIGRGGQFWNPGFLSFKGIGQISDYTDELFLMYENEPVIWKKIEGKENLEEKWHLCHDSGEFSFFEKLGFKLGEKIYVDGSGNPVGLTEEEVKTGIGTIDIDGQYNTTYCKYLNDCTESELLKILESDDYNNTDLIEEYFEEENIDWKKFNGDYTGLVEDWFNGAFDIDEYYGSL